MITARQIEAFRAVMLTHSMTTAAGMLCVTQSAVSKIMRELEHEVGFPLFVRTKGGLVPSAEAASLYTEVDRVYIGIDRVSHAAARIKQRHTGQLKLVSTSVLTTLFLQLVVKAFSEAHPRVMISLETYNSTEVIDLVGSRLFDIGYAMTPIDNDAVDVVGIFATRCVCILPSNHRLGGVGKVDITELSGDSFISLMPSNTTRLKIDALFRTFNVKRDMLYEAGWSASISALVAEGLGVSIIDPFTAVLAAKSGCLIAELAQEVDFSFAELRPRQMALNELVNEFSETFRQAFERFVGTSSTDTSGPLM